MGSAGIGALIAHLAFWILLVWGWTYDDLRIRGCVIAVSIWLAGFLGLPYLPYGASLFSSFVAVLDVGLAFVIFKGDIRLT